MSLVELLCVSLIRAHSFAPAHLRCDVNISSKEYTPNVMIYANDTPLRDLLQTTGIVPGIKVDSGPKTLVWGNKGETWCSGLGRLYDKCVSHYAHGSQFAKWRTALSINMTNNASTNYVTNKATHGLVCYTHICREEGLVSTIEPNSLINGIHRHQDQYHCCPGVCRIHHLPEAEGARHLVRGDPSQAIHTNDRR